MKKSLYLKKFYEKKSENVEFFELDCGYVVFFFCSKFVGYGYNAQCAFVCVCVCVVFKHSHEFHYCDNVENMVLQKQIQFIKQYSLQDIN